MTTEALGIFQSDLIIRSAVIAAIRDLRANPFLLDYAFASLPADTLTAGVYGASQVQKAKDWFLKTEINIYLNVNMNQVKFPCVSIALANSVEEENTLGDIHYQPFEDADLEWPVYAGPMDPQHYDPATGELVLDPNKPSEFILAPGLLVIDAIGGHHTILAVEDQTHVTIEPGLTVDLSGMQIRPQRPAQVASVESASFREMYSLGCHVDSEAVHLTYLHSVIVFALLRYRQTLLEARGYERSNISSSDFRRDDETLPEFLYSRYLQITGYVRQAWPKDIKPKIVAVITDPIPDAIVEEVPEEDFLSALGHDSLSVKLKP